MQKIIFFVIEQCPALYRSTNSCLGRQLLDPALHLGLQVAGRLLELLNGRLVGQPAPAGRLGLANLGHRRPAEAGF